MADMVPMALGLHCMKGLRTRTWNPKAFVAILRFFFSCVFQSHMNLFTKQVYYQAKTLNFRVLLGNVMTINPQENLSSECWKLSIVVV